MTKISSDPFRSSTVAIQKGSPVFFDTFFVSLLRLNQGKSPFLGSKDHFALRLEKMGLTRGWVVLIAAAAAGFMGFCAFLVTLLPLRGAILVYVLVAILVVWGGRRMALVEMK